MKLRVPTALCFLLTAFAAAGQDRVNTLAGTPLVSGIADGEPQKALFNDPAAIVADHDGNLFVADSANHVIRKISNGVVSTVAGRAGFAGFQDGPLSAFNSPSGIAVSSAGELFVADTGNHVIRKVTASGTFTIAGAAAQSGALDGVGNLARFDSPLGIVVATNGVIYVADSGNHTIRAISTGGVVTTFTGSAGNWGVTDGDGADARFNGPLGLALDGAGNLFVSDANNHTIRRISPDRAVTTWAGAPLADGFVNGSRRIARFSKPAELRFDSAGNLYVADSFNHAIRKIAADGEVTTVTGFSGAVGSSDGVNGHAQFYNPYSLAFLPDGRLAISDSYNQLIRRATPPIQLTLNAGARTVSWNSVIGSRYQIQTAASDFASWTTIAPATTAISTLSSFVGESDVTERVKFYRVIEVR